jgi:anthranilate synthase component 2
MRVLMIDNFDSFTYNLVDELEKQNCDVSVYRNNINLPEMDKIIAEEKFQLLVISPGPSNPKNSGICLPLIQKYSSTLPIFGVCLGFQCIIEAFGGKIQRCPEVYHGKSSIIHHNGKNLFSGLQTPIHVGRYHSLYASEVPQDFIIAAEYNQIPMAVYHKKLPLSGVQFHPESVLTASGNRIINNILRSIKNA